MGNGNVTEVTSLQSVIYLIFGRSPEKVMACISQGYMLSLKLKLNENCGSSSLLKMLTAEILQGAPNDVKLNSKHQT